jgi:hypothetical protein
VEEQNPYQSPDSAESAQQRPKIRGVRIHVLLIALGFAFAIANFMLPAIRPPGRTYGLLVAGIVMIVFGGLISRSSRS